MTDLPSRRRAPSGSAPSDGSIHRPDGPADYAAAIYGSLLAASTVLGTAAARAADPGSAELLAALLVTSTVFWMLHVYVKAVGGEIPRHVPWLTATARSARHELPILLAVIPPAAVVLVSMVLGEPAGRVAWGALLAALAGQVFWTWLAVRQADASRGIKLLSLVVSALLGLFLVALKLALGH